MNKLWTKREIIQVIDEVYRHCGQKETVIFADQLMNLGFKYAAKAGISFGKDDLIIPKNKQQLIDETKKLITEYENIIKNHPKQYCLVCRQQNFLYYQLIDRINFASLPC